MERSVIVAAVLVALLSTAQLEGLGVARASGGTESARGRASSPSLASAGTPSTSSGSSQAEAETTPCQSCVELNRLRSLVKPDPKLEVQQSAVVNRAYQVLKSFVKEAGQTQGLRSGQRLSDALDLGATLLQADPSLYAGEVLYPLYRDHQADFQAGLRNLPEARRRSILRAVQQFERELRSGNG
jgi:hypothetical protein